MEVTCAACSTKLNIPDEKVPQNTIFKITCPKCHEKIQVSTKPDGVAPPPAEAAPAPIAPPPVDPPDEAPPVMPPTAPPPVQDDVIPSPSLEQEVSDDIDPQPSEVVEDDFVEDQKLALMCFDQPNLKPIVKAALEALGYTVHVPAKMEDAAQKVRQNKYEVVLLHETYGGSVAGNLFLQTIQLMAMPLRRHMCVGLVGKSFRTLDNMMAFAKSVSFVVAERELPKIKAILRQAVSDNDQFYRVFREALREAGKQ